MLSINTCDDLNSDHTPIIANFRTTNLEKHENQQLITSRTDISIFQKYIHDNIDLNISIKNCKDIEDAIENFINTTHHAAKLSTPKRVDMYQSGFHITCEIRRLIREKRRLRKVWQTTRQPSDKTMFNRATNQLKLRLMEYKNESIGNFLINLNPVENNEHSLWRATKYLKKPIQKADGSWL